MRQTFFRSYRQEYDYYYYRRDHLGNNVAVWNATADSTVQRTFYYASGLPMSCSTGQSAQSRKYNGKEYVEDHGFDVYDYGFRGYYATIGRFTSIDPLTEQAPWQSPYVYADNNFVNNIDYWGLAAIGSTTGFHANIPVTTLNWVAVDKEGNVVDWGDDEDDYHVYLVDEFWDGTYAGLKEYEMVGWEIRSANFSGYTLGSPCYYVGSVTMGYWKCGELNAKGSMLLMYGRQLVSNITISSSSYDVSDKYLSLFNDALSIGFILAEKAFQAVNYTKIGNITKVLPILNIANELNKPQPNKFAIAMNVVSLSNNIYVAGAIFMIDCYSIAWDYIIDSYNYLNSRLTDLNYWGDVYLNGY